MKITYFAKLLPAIISLSIALPLSSGAEEVSRQDSLVVRADELTYQQSDETYRANGNVRLEWEGMELVSDRALLRQSEGTAEAEGRVVVTTDGDKLVGDKLTMDLEKQTGEMENGYLFKQQGNFHLRGKKLQKVGREDYHLVDGTFTVCDGDSPSWKFSASSVDVTLGEYATGKNVLFFIRDIPVFYFPYMMFPVKRERQSGFLFPKAGTTTKKGFNLNIPYYWAISPSQDVTFFLDFLSKRGVGTAVDYRYIRKSGSSGGFYGYTIYDTDLEKLRGELYQNHQEVFSDTLFFSSNIGYVSDRDYLRDFSEAFGEYNRKSIDTTIFLSKHWNRFLLVPEVRYTQDLEAASNVTTLQKLPIITFTGIRQRIGTTSLFASLDSSFINFFREKGLQGQRLEVHPTLTYHAKPAEWLEGSAWAGYQERFYNTYDGLPDDFSDMGLFDAGVKLSSTLSRVYDTGWNGLVKVRHAVVPEVGYQWVESRGQEELPFFDYNDRVVHRNAVSYGVANYLTGKFVNSAGNAVYRDLAYVRLSQEYDLSGSRRDLLTAYDELRPFGDFRLETKITPVPWFSFATDSRLNPYTSNFSNNNVALSVNDSTGNSASFGYRFTKENWEYLEGRVGISYLKPFFFNFAARYALDKGDFLESFYAMEYRQQCWGVTLSYSDRQNNRSFFINFSLAGIGPLGRLRLL